jgi:hypothetical protein
MILPRYPLLVPLLQVEEWKGLQMEELERKLDCPIPQLCHQ